MNTTPKSRKKVLIMVTRSNMGGAQKYAFDLAKSMNKEQFEVKLVAGGNGQLFNKCKDHGVETISIPYLERDISLIKEIKVFFSILKILKKEKPDIIQLNSPKMGGLAGLAARIIGISKIIYTNHGWTFNEDRSVLQKLLIKLFSWLIVLLSHRTIVLSEKEMNDVANWIFIKNKIQKIPLGIEEPKFIEKTEARSNLMQIANVVDNGQKIILSIGELTKNKGYIYAIEALKKYEQPFTYLIIGDGELKNFLQEKIKEFDLESKVKLLGFIPDASRYLKSCDFLLLPSIKEGLPYVILEAGFAEIPVIATNVGGICELAQNTDHNNILIKAKSSDSILNSIKDAKYFYAKKLSLKDMIEKTIEIMLSQ